MRIRTIKPEFHQNEKLATLPREVRLLAAALLNVADDNGYFRSHPALIAGALFPFDKDGYEFVARGLVDLQRIDYVDLFQEGVGLIKHFELHQVINRPTKSRLKDKAVTPIRPPDPSVNAHGVLTEGEKSLTEGSGTGKWNREVEQEQGDVEQARPVEVSAVARPSKKRAAAADARILEVFEHWKQVLDHPKAKLGDERERAVKARLAQGYTVDDLKRAVDGCAVTPHNMGQNDRGEVYDDLALICRDGGQVERFMRNAESPPVAARSASAPVPPSDFGPSTGPIVATIGSLF